MKKQTWYVLLAAAVFMLAACGTPTPTAAPATQPPTNPGEGTYPPPIATSAYPAAQQDPAVTQAPVSDQMYPWLEDGSMLQWPQAIALLQNGQVSRAMQAHDLTVTLTLKDGRTLTVAEPVIDEVLRVIEACGAPCADIAVATE